MENAIVENIEKLYKLQMFNLIMVVALIVVTAVCVALVVKCKVLHAKWGNVALVALVVSCSVGLLLLQIRSFLPVYRDYTEQSYIVIEDVEVIVKESTADLSNRVCPVVVYNGEEEITLQMQIDHSLNMGDVYAGKIAYLKHSHYLIWYDFS